MGLLDDRARRQLEQRYRCALPDRTIRSAGVDLPAPAPAPEETDMELIARLRALLGLTDGDPDDLIVERVRDAQAVADAAGTYETEIRAALGLAEDADLPAALPGLRREAEAGRAYRESLVSDALTEAVRALGAEAHDRYAPVLAGLDLDAVRAMRDDWASVAAQRLPGGRLTVESAPTDPAPAPVTAPPADVYRAG